MRSHLILTGSAQTSESRIQCKISFKIDCHSDLGLKACIQLRSPPCHKRVSLLGEIEFCLCNTIRCNIEYLIGFTCSMPDSSPNRWMHPRGILRNMLPDACFLLTVNGTGHLRSHTSPEFPLIFSG